MSWPDDQRPYDGHHDAGHPGADGRCTGLGHDVHQNDGRVESRRHDNRHVYGHVLANRPADDQQMNHPDGASHHDDWDDPGRCAYRRTEERKNLT